MTSSSSVGASAGRTPFKHDLMSRIIGQTIGACAFGRRRIGCANRWHIDDLCAGDGVDSRESGACSPRIIRHHLDFRTGGQKIRADGGRATATLWERDLASFAGLRERYGDDPHIILRNEDSRAFTWGADDDAVRLVLADPNNVHQLPIDADFYARRMPRYGSLLFTLGFNAGGLKRAQLEDRQRWLLIMHVIGIMRPAHDAVLIMLNQDSSQWAYLVVYPRVWAKDLSKLATASALGTKRSAAYWPQGVQVISYRENGATAWRAAFERLVLTRQEWLEREQPGLWPDDEAETA